MHFIDSYQTWSKRTLNETVQKTVRIRNRTEEHLKLGCWSKATTPLLAFSALIDGTNDKAG